MYYYYMKNFLVTGALGFIGSNFVNYMSIKYPYIKIVVLDKKDYCSDINNINKQSLHNTEIIIGDILNKELVTYILNKHDIDTIVHFAAQTHVDNSFFNSITFTENNVLGTHTLLECARIYNDTTKRLEKFVHVSTDEVYGEVLQNDEIRNEGSILEPTNPYAASKAAAEFFVKSYFYSYKLPIIITRGNNVYGINQYPEKVIPKFICQLLRKEKLTIQGTGKSIRNFIYVNDTCTAFETIILNGKIGEVYNISSGLNDEYSVMDLARILIKEFYPEADVNNPEILKNYITYVEDRKFNDYRYWISNDKLTQLGWKPVHTNFIENIKIIISWYKKNLNRFYPKI